MALLREIKRLHLLLNNCWQALDTLPPQRLHSSLDLLKGYIDREPCVIEQREAYARAGRGNMSRIMSETEMYGGGSPARGGGGLGNYGKPYLQPL